jgi:type IV secretion system protein VirD4
VLPPPDPRAGAAKTVRADDWSGLPPVVRRRPGSAAAAKGEDQDGGIRREPTLPEHEQIAPEPGPLPEKEFAFLEDEPDDEAVRARALGARMRTVARQAALDPDDGIAL